MVLTKKNFLIILFICGCTSKMNPERPLERFLPEQINHFPKKNNGLLSRHTVYPSEQIQNNIGVWHIGRYSLDSQSDFVAKSIQNRFFVTYKDECVLILPSRSLIDSKVDEPKKNKCNITAEFIPLPSIFNNLDRFNATSKIENYLIYPLEIDQGRFIHKNNLLNSDNLPLEWGHGISKGVAIDSINMEVVFWTEIW